MRKLHTGTRSRHVYCEKMEGKSFKHPEVSSSNTRRYETDINFRPKTVYRKRLFLRLLSKMVPRRPKYYVMPAAQNAPFSPHFSSVVCTTLARECGRPLGRDKEEILYLLLSTELPSVKAIFIIHYFYIVLIYLLIFFGHAFISLSRNLCPHRQANHLNGNIICRLPLSLNGSDVYRTLLIPSRGS